LAWSDPAPGTSARTGRRSSESKSSSMVEA
jgi:hypothetical protein